MENQIEQAQELVIKDFDLQAPKGKFSDLGNLQSWLAKEISYLLDSEFEKLINILYRIDVNEIKLKAAFAGTDIANEIAGLIIERELQKVETRKKYKE